MSNAAILINMFNNILNHMVNKRDKNSSFNTVRQLRPQAAWDYRKKYLELRDRGGN